MDQQCQFLDDHMRLPEPKISALPGEPREARRKAPRLPEISNFFNYFPRFPYLKTLPDKMLEKDEIAVPPSSDAAATQHRALPTRNGPPERKGTLPRGPFFLDIPVLNQLRGKRCILASQSPRRKQILAPAGQPLVTFTCFTLANLLLAWIKF
jgi:hypothetical protein